MNEYGIDLIGQRHEDGSVTVCSPDLPMFCVVGADDKHALATAMAVLPEYLRANVPAFVELKQIPSATELLGGKRETILPAHIVAITSRNPGDAGKGAS